MFLLFHLSDKRLIAFSNQEILSIPLINCSVYKTCKKCIFMQDPYCGWHVLNNACVETDNNNTLIKQSDDLINFPCEGDVQIESNYLKFI